MKRIHVLLILLALTIFGSVRHYFTLPHVVDRVRSSVVYVQVQSKSGQRWSGSGVVLDNGLILTARHVIEDANSIAVIFDDGSRVRPSEYFVSEDLGVVDVGLIIIGDRGDHACFSLFSIDVGDTVFTIGSPFGLQNSVAVGVFSAYNRDIGDERLHQLDLDSNPGMSGCPVFNRYGFVIGIDVRGNGSIALIVPLEVCKAVVGIYENVQKTKVN